MKEPLKTDKNKPTIEQILVQHQTVDLLLKQRQSQHPLYTIMLYPINPAGGPSFELTRIHTTEDPKDLSKRVKRMLHREGIGTLPEGFKVTKASGHKCGIFIDGIPEPQHEQWKEISEFNQRKLFAGAYFESQLDFCIIANIRPNTVKQAIASAKRAWVSKGSPRSEEPVARVKGFQIVKASDRYPNI